MTTLRLAPLVTLLLMAPPAFAQTRPAAPCTVTAEADLIAALPGDWRLALGAGTQTVSGGTGAPLEPVADPVAATVTDGGEQMLLVADEFGAAGLYFALPSQDSPLGTTDADGGYVFVDAIGIGPCDPAGLPRLIGGAAGADGAELALDLYAFGPEVYAGSLSYRVGETVWVRSVTLTR